MIWPLWPYGKRKLEENVPRVERWWWADYDLQIVDCWTNVFCEQWNGGDWLMLGIGKLRHWLLGTEGIARMLENWETQTGSQTLEAGGVAARSSQPII